MSKDGGIYVKVVKEGAVTEAAPNTVRTKQSMGQGEVKRLEIVGVEAPPTAKVGEVFIVQVHVKLNALRFLARCVATVYRDSTMVGYGMTIFTPLKREGTVNVLVREVQEGVWDYVVRVGFNALITLDESSFSVEVVGSESETAS